MMGLPKGHTLILLYNPHSAGKPQLKISAQRRMSLWLKPSAEKIINE